MRYIKAHKNKKSAKQTQISFPKLKHRTLLLDTTMYLMKMIIPTVSILVMTAFTPTGVLAQPKLGGGLRDGNGDRPGGNRGPGNGMGGGRGGGRGGPFGGFNHNDVEFVSDICQGLNPTTCDLPPRRHAVDNDGNAATGIFVCRTRTNPRTQETNTFSMCIPEDRGIEGDGCGCCDPTNCPTPCECPCDLMDRDGNPRVDQDGNPIIGALVTVEGTEDDNCVPQFASAVMVERSDGAVTCASCVA